MYLLYSLMFNFPPSVSVRFKKGKKELKDRERKRKKLHAMYRKKTGSAVFII